MIRVQVNSLLHIISFTFWPLSIVFVRCQVTVKVWENEVRSIYGDMLTLRNKYNVESGIYFYVP